MLIFPKHNLLGDTVSHALKYLSGAENHHINVFFSRRKAAWCFSASLPPLLLMVRRNLSRFSSTNAIFVTIGYQSLLSQLSSSIIILTFRSLRSLKKKEMSWQRRKLLHASTCSSTRFLYLLRSSISSIASKCSSFLL